MLNDGVSLNRANCSQIVTHYLVAQGWQLIDPSVLADQLWHDFGTQNLTGPAAVKAMQNQVWQHYAMILHDACRQTDYTRREQAWAELQRWLQHQSRQLTSDPAEQETLAQDAVTDLQRHLSQTPLKSSRALWAYAMQTMRRKQIDEHRRRTAVMRGEGLELSLEELGDSQPDGEESDWEEKLASRTDSERSVEESVETEQIREQVRAFFQDHLPTELQRQVAEAHFLDGLTPQEIAAQLGKKPHEIRMVKARVAETLRTLPTEARRKLLSVLGDPRDKNQS